MHSMCYCDVDASYRTALQAAAMMRRLRASATSAAPSHIQPTVGEGSCNPHCGQRCPVVVQYVQIKTGFSLLSRNTDSPSESS